MTEDYIFPTGKVAATNVLSIDLGLKEPPLRSFSTNLAENKENAFEEIIDDYDTPIATQSNKYENLAVRQSQVEHCNNNLISNVDFVYYNGTTEQSEKSKTANKNEQIKSSFFGNRKKLIIFSSILFVVVIVAIIAVIMIVLATASKGI
jgi:hypothetical protein